MVDQAAKSNWHKEKPRPNFNFRWQIPATVFRTRLARLMALFFLVITTITLYWILTGNKKPEHDLDQATKEYNDYLASPQHRALIYPDPDDRAQGKAAIIALVRNSELGPMAQSMRELEETFNRKFKYPWIFFNDEPFSDQFKRITNSLTDAETYYERIPKEHWDVPQWIQPDLMQASFDKLDQQRVQYAKMLSYHKMCRWNSGMFYIHPALANYTWYWRVEPNVHFFCEVDYDVFRFMELNDKTYGFVINIYDSPDSIRTLWPTTLEYLAMFPDAVHPNSAIEWLTDSTRRPRHNLIANGNLNFWRSDRYQSYFNYLDRQGGFFYERWGDAPVHSVALGLFEDKNKIHWFHDIGYNHIPYFNCPASNKCRGCDAGKFFEGTGLGPENCKPLWDKVVAQKPGSMAGGLMAAVGL